MDDCATVQNVLIHKDVINWLGGMTMMETIKGLAVTPKQGRVGMWYAQDDDGKVVGALLSGGRPAAFRAKYGSVGVLNSHRRQRIGTALYTAMTIQGIFEGKRLWEDSIVGDNPYQFAALPTFGLKKVGELRHRTGSGKGLVLFDFSLLEPGAFDLMMSRTAGRGFVYHVLENNFAREVWNANQGAYAKSFPGFEKTITDLREDLRSRDFIRVDQDDTNPTDERRLARELRGV
jgi:hypothetical protein